MRLKEKILATNLRKTGKTYNEIHSVISYISKGTLSRWLSHIELTKEQNKIIEERSYRGRLKASLTNRSKKRERIQLYFRQARQLFVKYSTNSFFIAGLILYWAEGTKTTESVHFMNSDPRLVKLMIKWVQKYLHVSNKKMRARLYIHKIYAHENHEQFWKKIIILPKKQFLKTIYKPTPHTVKRNPNYKGCIRIDAGGVQEFYMIKFWQELFSKKHKLMPL